MASDLRPAELFKYDYRVEKFLEKYTTESPFTTTKNTKVVLLVQHHILELVKKRDARTLVKTPLITKTGQHVMFSELAKTSEFGGRGGGGVTQLAVGEAVHGLLYRMHHLDASYKLYTPTAAERGEYMVLQDINQYIAHLETPITMNVNGKLLHNIYGANKVDGTPKADIALVAYNAQRKKFEEVYYLSHKLGNDASGFQQYGGITPDADGKMPGSISEHPEVLEFLARLAEVHDRVLNNRERFYMNIQDDVLIGRAVYGPEFPRGVYTLDNIQMIAQGNPVLRPQGAMHSLTFSAAASSFSPDISHFKSGPYQAVLGATYRTGRRFTSNGKNYADVRVSIMPIKLLGGNAKNIKTLDNSTEVK